MLMKGKYSTTILICLMVMAVSSLSPGCLTAIMQPDLDSVGGIYILLEAAEASEEAMKRAVKVIRDRMGDLGVERPLVKREGARQIRVELPGYRDEERVLNVITRNARLSFAGPDGKEIINEGHLSSARAESDPARPCAYLNIELDKEGTALFAEATKKFLNRPISIILDDELVAQPVIISEITEGKAVIELQLSYEEVFELAVLLGSGALPVTLQVIEFRVVEGEDHN